MMNAKSNPLSISQQAPESSEDQNLTVKSSVTSLKPTTTVQKSCLNNSKLHSLEEKKIIKTQLKNKKLKFMLLLKSFFKSNRNKSNKYYFSSNDLQKFGGDKIKLGIDSEFECDKAISYFVYQIQPLSERVRYFNWNIKGQFSDHDCARLFEDLIKKMANLFSLNLNFVSHSFGDRAAEQLGKALRSQKKLRIFNIKLLKPGNYQMTLFGFNKIRASLSTLPNIEIFNHNFRDYYYENYKVENQNNFQLSFLYNIYQFYLQSSIGDEIWQEAISTFSRNIDQKANILLQISLTHFNYRSYDIEQPHFSNMN